MRLNGCTIFYLPLGCRLIFPFPVVICISSNNYGVVRMKKIAACYIRVSTDEQTELSPDSQLEALKDYAAAHDYSIPEEYIFKDEGISGRTTKKRPEFNRMIGVAKTKPRPFDAVLLWKFSRFARNRTDAIVYKNLLRNELGIDVISISENLGENKGTALILESMFEAMDEYYSINLSTEVKRSMKMKAEKGQPLSVAPFGYKMINKQLIIDPVKAEIVKYIFSAFENGDGVNKIARFLCGSGIKTNRGSAPDNRFVSYILKNPVYCGYTRWCPEGRANYGREPETNAEKIILAKGTHAQIITEEQFNRTQARILEIKERHKKYRRPESSNDWLLKGLIKCDACGSTLVRMSEKKQALQCHSYNRGKCNVSHYLTLPAARSAIIGAVNEAFKALTFDIHSETIFKTEQNKAQMLRRLIGAEEAKLSRIREAYETGVDSIEEFRENKKRVVSCISKLKAELTETDQKQNNAAKDSKKVTDALLIINDESADVGLKNTILRAIIDRIDFCKPQNELRIFFYV